MNWHRRTYQIRFENGDQESVDGIANRLFGLSESGVLTHLKTGFRVAQFSDQAAAKAAGDYLTAVYAEEFDALNKVSTESMTYDQFRSLTEAADLNAKVNGDKHFSRHIAAGAGRGSDNK